MDNNGKPWGEIIPLFKDELRRCQCGGNLGCLAALDVVHLHLNADGLLFHVCNLLCCSFSHFCILRKVFFGLP